MDRWTKFYGNLSTTSQTRDCYWRTGVNKVCRVHHLVTMNIFSKLHSSSTKLFCHVSVGFMLLEPLIPVQNVFLIHRTNCGGSTKGSSSRPMLTLLDNPNTALTFPLCLALYVYGSLSVRAAELCYSPLIILSIILCWLHIVIADLKASTCKLNWSPAANWPWLMARSCEWLASVHTFLSQSQSSQQKKPRWKCHIASVDISTIDDLRGSWGVVPHFLSIWSCTGICTFLAIQKGRKRDYALRRLHIEYHRVDWAK